MNWTLTSNSNFFIIKSSQPDGVHHVLFKLCPFDLEEFIVWNVKGMQHQVAKI